jgi:hypothetical protein
VRWYHALATRDDLAQVWYIEYDYWTELSGGSRLAIDAAERIRQGIEVFGVDSGGFWYLAEALKAGASFPELILVGAEVERLRQLRYRSVADELRRRWAGEPSQLEMAARQVQTRPSRAEGDR